MRRCICAYVYCAIIHEELIIIHQNIDIHIFQVCLRFSAEQHRHQTYIYTWYIGWSIDPEGLHSTHHHSCHMCCYIDTRCINSTLTAQA